jgi:hypothetical protein
MPFGSLIGLGRGDLAGVNMRVTLAWGWLIDAAAKEAADQKRSRQEKTVEEFHGINRMQGVVEKGRAGRIARRRTQAREPKWRPPTRRPFPATESSRSRGERPFFLPALAG